jgi:hypothetical protein
MKYLLIFIALISSHAEAQLSSIVVRNDTIFNYNPSTAVYTQLNKFIPTQTGQNGKVLGTNGTSFQWVNPSGEAGISLLDVYPVGSIYISVSSTNPSSLFGGTWVAFASGRTLIGVDANQTEFDTVEETGGSKTKTLNTTEIPSHSHVIPDVRSATTGAANTLIARTADASSTAGNDVATGSTGGGQAFSILNPYITVYFFKRTQ